MSTDKKQPVDPKLTDKKIRAHIESELPPDADAEELFNNFWKKNGASIFSTVALCLAVILGVQIYHYLKDRSQEKKEAAYAACETLDDYTAFADDYEGDMLGGAAVVKLANASYEAGDYAKALEQYKAALHALEGTILYERADLGYAMSGLILGNADAVAILQNVANNSGYLDGTRAEAGYNLAVYYWEQKDFVAMKATIDSILALKTPGISGMRAQRLEATIPELKTDKEPEA